MAGDFFSRRVFADRGGKKVRAILADGHAEGFINFSL
jgi:hypothetical protein